MNQAFPALHARDYLLSVLQITTAPTPVAFLLEVGETLGLPSGGLRVALTRLLKSGLLLSPARGQYVLAPKADPLGRYLRAWRLGEGRVQPWSGEWLGCLLQEPTPSRKERTRSLSALERMGYQAVHPKLWVRPDCVAPELQPGLALTALGLESGTLCFTLRSEQSWSERWNTELLNVEYRGLAQSLVLEARALQDLPIQLALAQSFHRGKECIECLGFDPLLPSDWVDDQARAQAVQALLEYDAQARQIWAKTLRAAGWSGELLTHLDGTSA